MNEMNESSASQPDDMMNVEPLLPNTAVPAESGESVSRVAELEESLQRTKDHLLRALADAENTRKRAIKDREDAGKYAISSFARDLLDFSDNFQRALAAIPADLKTIEPRIESVMVGVEAMAKELLNTFEKHGIKKIEPLDQPFDANFHEVMFEAPNTGKPAGTIIQVIDAGYVIKDRLLRPARVGVAKDDGSAAMGSRIDTQA
jgi:molecular chaperone GrpE